MAHLITFTSRAQRSGFFMPERRHQPIRDIDLRPNVEFDVGLAVKNILEMKIDCLGLESELMSTGLTASCQLNRIASNAIVFAMSRFAGEIKPIQMSSVFSDFESEFGFKSNEVRLIDRRIRDKGRPIGGVWTVRKQGYEYRIALRSSDRSGMEQLMFLSGVFDSGNRGSISDALRFLVVETGVYPDVLMMHGRGVGSERARLYENDKFFGPILGAYRDWLNSNPTLSKTN